MTYFAIGESDGGAGERRLGPFDTPDEAEAAGKRETKDSNGAFVFKGVVDEANNQVFVDVEPVVSTNAVVRNAIAANRRVARNDKYKDFGQNVKAEINDDGSCFIEIATNGLISPYGKNANDCKAKALIVVKTLERKASELKQAIAWLEQNAK